MKHLPAALSLAVVFSRALAAESPDLPPPAATNLWQPVPPVVSAPANGVPSDAIVLFDGANLDAWESLKNPGSSARWKIEDGAIVVARGTGDIRTKRAFGDIQLHLEFRTPAEVTKSGQRRGNSGVFFMQQYELQVLDSFKNPTYVNGQAASIYKQHIPLVNASRGPGQWESYDVVFVAPRFSVDGKLESPARMTVFHNGVLVHHDVELKGPTSNRGKPPYRAHPEKLPLSLQDHGDPVAFRNIWVRELALPATE